MSKPYISYINPKTMKDAGMSHSLLRIAQQACPVLTLCGLGVQFKVWPDGVPGLVGQ